MSRRGENIYKRKDGRWEGRYKTGTGANGRTQYKSYYGKTYREVKSKLEHCRQTPRFEIVKTKNVVKLFGTYCDEWLAVNRDKVKESTLAKYHAALENHIKPYFGKYSPEMITTEQTADFLNEIIHIKHLSAKTAKDLAVLLKTILKYIAKCNNNMRLIDVSMPKTKAREMRILSKEEQKRFVDYLLKDMDFYKFGTLFALMTGLRIGEVCALRASDINMEEKTVTVRETVQRIKNLDGNSSKTKIVFSTPKSNTSVRVVPLTNTVYTLCKINSGKMPPNAFLLTGKEDKVIEPRTLQYHIKRYSKACGIEDMHFHVLRHTFATRCVEVGFEIKSLSEVLGHSSPQITLERYIHSSLELKRQNMTKLEAIGW